MMDTDDPMRPMTEQEIKLGRMVRQVWLDFCKQSRLPESHSHSAPWEELTLWEKNVDERIGTALFSAGCAAARAEAVAVLRARADEHQKISSSLAHGYSTREKAATKYDEAEACADAIAAIAPTAQAGGTEG